MFRETDSWILVWHNYTSFLISKFCVIPFSLTRLDGIMTHIYTHYYVTLPNHNLHSILSRTVFCIISRYTFPPICQACDTSSATTASHILRQRELSGLKTIAFGSHRSWRKSPAEAERAQTRRYRSDQTRDTVFFFPSLYPAIFDWRNQPGYYVSAGLRKSDDAAPLRANFTAASRRAKPVDNFIRSYFRRKTSAIPRQCLYNYNDCSLCLSSLLYCYRERPVYIHIYIYIYWHYFRTYFFYRHSCLNYYKRIIYEYLWIWEGIKYRALSYSLINFFYTSFQDNIARCTYRIP